MDEYQKHDAKREKPDTKSTQCVTTLYENLEKP